MASLTHNRKFPSQLLGFGLAGGLAFAVDLLIFNLVAAVSERLSLANLVAAAVSLIVNYLVNHRVFRPSKRVSDDLGSSTIKFGVVGLVSFAYLVTLFELAMALLPGASQLVLSVVRVGILLTGSAVRFYLLRQWVFRVREAK